MIYAILTNPLSIIGLFQIITTTVKISKRYPLRRWFF